MLVEVSEHDGVPLGDGVKPGAGAVRGVLSGGGVRGRAGYILVIFLLRHQQRVGLTASDTVSVTGTVWYKGAAEGFKVS